MELKRTLYLGYNLRQLDQSIFDWFLNYTIEKTGRTRASVNIGIIHSIFKDYMGKAR